MKKGLVLISLCTISFFLFSNESEEKEALRLKATKAQVNEKAISKDLIVLEQENKSFSQEFNKLPHHEDAMFLTEEEVHSTPSLMKEAAAVVARVHSEAENNPVLRKSALQFFKSCVADQDGLTPVRAICLKKIFKLMPKWRVPIQMDDLEIPPRVHHLAFK